MTRRIRRHEKVTAHFHLADTKSACHREPEGRGDLTIEPGRWPRCARHDKIDEGKTEAIHEKIRSTTVLAVLRDGRLAFAGDGQVSMGNTIIKSGAAKIRTMRDGKILAGFAGSTADALTLFEKFEAKLDQFNGNVVRSAVELAKDWRTDKMLRRLEALLLVGDKTKILTLSGNGDVIEPDDGIAAIGSGGPFALAAARAMLRETTLGAREIAERALKIASEICVFTNDRIIIQELK